MSKANVIKIERLEVNKSDIEKVKRAFRVKDNAEAIRKHQVKLILRVFLKNTKGLR